MDDARRARPRRCTWKTLGRTLRCLVAVARAASTRARAGTVREPGFECRGEHHEGNGGGTIAGRSMARDSREGTVGLAGPTGARATVRGGSELVAVATVVATLRTARRVCQRPFGGCACAARSRRHLASISG